MISFKEIVQSNQKTFYDYSRGEGARVSSFQIYKVFFSIVFAFVFSNLGAGFLGIVLSIYAILTGFGFNILFYLINFQKGVDTTTLEQEVLSKKINKLSTELFYNVAYFNLISVALIILCLLHYLFSSLDLNIINSLAGIPIFNKVPEVIPSLLAKMGELLILIYNGLFYYFLIESLFTFVRITSRAFYMFQKVIAMNDED